MADRIPGNKSGPRADRELPESAMVIRRIRETWGLNRLELAEIVGVSEIAVQFWEQGLRAPGPRIWRLLELEGYYVPGEGGWQPPPLTSRSRKSYGKK